MRALPNFSTSSATEGFDESGVVIFAAEPGETSEHVKFFKDGAQADSSSMTWVQDAERGNVLSLDGNSEYLAFGSDESLGSKYLKTRELTFMTWINFRGTTDSANPAGAYWQRLLTIYQNADCYLTMSPHAYDEIDHADADGRFLNGWYLQFKRTGAEGSIGSVDRECYEPVMPSEGNFGLVQNEWHHVAIVIDQRYNMMLYIDGRAIDLGEEGYIGVDFEQIYADWLLVGRGIPGDVQGGDVADRVEAPFLNALLDDTLLYNRALSAEEIAVAAQTGDGEEELYMPTTTEPTYPSTVPTEFPDDKPNNPFGLPTWGFAVCVGLLAVVIVVTVLVNMYEVSWRRANKEAAEKARREYEAKLAAGQAVETSAPKKKANKDEKTIAAMTKKEEKQAARRAKKQKDDDEPVLSIKQAALKKRREELEQFLEEERREREEQNDEY